MLFSRVTRLTAEPRYLPSATSFTTRQQTDLFGGHSIGKWEGKHAGRRYDQPDGRAYFGVGNTSRLSKELHLTERFTVVSDKLILFELTYNDPKTFTRPIKSAGFYYPSSDEDEELAPELTCHEGSYALLDAFGF